jgi:lipoprotein-anchoring transpeptidase ErfK/SrfK
MRERAVRIRFRDKLNLPSGRSDSMMQSPYGYTAARATDFLSDAGFRYAALVRRYTKYRAAQPRRGRVVWWSTAALLAGAAWVAWEQGYFPEAGKPGRIAPVPATNVTSAAQPEAPPRAAISNTPSNIVPVSFTGASSNVAQPRTSPPSGRASAVLEAQIALDRQGISCGSIDGVLGSQTRAALRALQLREGLPLTGALDNEARARLVLNAPALTNYRVDPADLARLRPLSPTWLGKSEQARLDYELLIELIAERSHAHPNLIRRLNPGMAWDNIAPGTLLAVPAAERERAATRAAFIQIRLSDRTLEAFDSANRLLAHFPCSIAQRVEKRPVGELRVAVTAPNPNYTFDPEVFPESAEARELGRKLVLPPGPNNPVGTVWIGLDRPGYGIHGTPKPEDVGRTESHGCFRLANWNAEYLLSLVTVGTPVRVEP